MLQRIRRQIILPLSIISLVVACNPSPGKMEVSGESLDIYPDYLSIVIPPNIAPMNFQIRNEGKAFIADISNSKERSIRIRSRKGNIEIPGRVWRKILEEDMGGSLVISVCKKSFENQWEKMAPVKNDISTDEIDTYIAFRKIPTANIGWKEMGIYQRSMENFRETPIMVNNLTGENCMNCHSFNNGDPEQMLFHMRGPYEGTLLKDQHGVHFVNTNSEHTRSAGAYPSWHPDGELIAFSVNKINQGFHSRIGKTIFVTDKFSDIILYDMKDNSITRPAELATEKLENFPVWSNDGRKLYYICTDRYDETKPRETILYNLMQVGFDVETRKFGNSDTLVSAKDFGKSITFPRESSSKGLLSFIGVDYGYFSIYNQEANVYFYHTQTGEISKPGINSEYTESYPSWSGNGSWLMFVSKRDDGVLSQVWFSHIDESGNASKPFVLPQRHPDFYSEYMYNYNRPEFITGKVKLNPRKVLSVAKRDPDQSGFNQEASVSVTTGATLPASKQQEAGFYQYD